VPFNDLEALERTLERNKGRGGHDRGAGDDERGFVLRSTDTFRVS
jgi:hypothetical protein